MSDEYADSALTPDSDDDDFDPTKASDQWPPEPPEESDLPPIEKAAQEASSPDERFRILAEELAGMPRSERIARVFGRDLYDYQKAIADDPCADVVVTCGRQVGKTEIGAGIAADATLFSPGEDVMLAALWQDTADELFRRVKDLFERCPFSLDELGVTKANAREWEFSHGGRIYARSLNQSAGADSGDTERGKNPKTVIIDESALVPKRVFEEVINPMFATHGDNHDLYLFSTPRGTSGYHYNKHVHDDEWSEHRVRTPDSGLVDDEWIEKKRRTTDTFTWEQEYLGKFKQDDDSYLPHEIVDPCTLADPNDPGVGDDPDAIVNPRNHPDYVAGAPRVLGVDVARAGRDRTVYYDIGLDGVTRGVQSEAESSIDGVVREIKSLHANNGYAAILVDENSLGGGVIDFGRWDLAGVIRPVKFSGKQKQRLYQALKRSFESEEIVLPYNERLITETTSLQYSYTQHGRLRLQHPDNGHDDYPDALSLANWGRYCLGRTWDGSPADDSELADGDGSSSSSGGDPLRVW